jgi:hypothetical protein
MRLAILASCLILETMVAWGQVRVPGPGGPLAAVGEGGACTPVTGYAHCRTLTIDHTQVGGTTLSNYPIITTLALGGSKIQNASCFDVVFTSDTTGTVKIPWEQEAAACDSSTGVYKAWVKIASVSSSADTVFAVSYGNAAVGTAQNTGSLAAANVWNGNFSLVGHLPNGSVVSLVDSTVNNTNISQNSGTGTAGQIDGAGHLASGQRFRWDHVAGVPNGGPQTLSCWFNMGGFTGYQIMLMTWDGGSNGSIIRTDGSGHITAVNFAGLLGSINVPSTGAWHLLHLTYDGTTWTIYLDGVSASTSTTAANTGSAFYFGSGDVPAWGQDVSNGTFDEDRLMNIAVPAGWVTLDFNSQKAASTVITAGAEV